MPSFTTVGCVPATVSGTDVVLGVVETLGVVVVTGVTAAGGAGLSGVGVG